VQSSKTVTNAQLRAKLIELNQSAGKPFGLLIDDIAGGFTVLLDGDSRKLSKCLPLVSTRYFLTDGRMNWCAEWTLWARRWRRLTKIVATGDTPEVFKRLLRRGIGIRSRVCGVARDFDFGVGSAEKREFDGPAADLAAARARRDQDGRPAVRRARKNGGLILLLVTTAAGTAKGAQVPQDKRPHAAGNAR